MYNTVLLLEIQFVFYIFLYHCTGDISVSGSTLNSLEYEWEDAKYKWNEDRDLKDSEQFFSSGDYIDRNDQGALKTAFKAFMNQMYKNLEPHEEHDKATLQKVKSYYAPT